MFDSSNWLSLMHHVLFPNRDFDHSPTRKRYKPEPQKEIKLLGKSGFKINFKDENGSPYYLTLNAWNETDAWATVLTRFPQAQLVNIENVGYLIDPNS